MENATKVVNTEKTLTTTTIVTVKNGSIAESETTQEVDPNLTYIEKLQLKYKCCLLDWIIVLFCKKGKFSLFFLFRFFLFFFFFGYLFCFEKDLLHLFAYIFFTSEIIPSFFFSCVTFCFLFVGKFV